MSYCDCIQYIIVGFGVLHYITYFQVYSYQKQFDLKRVNLTVVEKDRHLCQKDTFSSDLGEIASTT